MIDYKPMKTEFSFGGFWYKQIKRVCDVALYSRTNEKTGADAGYEVIILTRHDGYCLSGTYIPPAEILSKKRYRVDTWQEAMLCFDDRVALECPTIKACEYSLLRFSQRHPITPPCPHCGKPLVLEISHLKNEYYIWSYCIFCVITWAMTEDGFGYGFTAEDAIDMLYLKAGKTIDLSTADFSEEI